MATFSGFAPNWYFGQRDAGLNIYISPGFINGLPFNGQLAAIPAKSTITVWINSDGTNGVGSSAPNGSYSVATVVSSSITVGGNYTNPNLIADGISNITDIRIR